MLASLAETIPLDKLVCVAHDPPTPARKTMNTLLFANSVLLAAAKAYLEANDCERLLRTVLEDAILARRGDYAPERLAHANAMAALLKAETLLRGIVEANQMLEKTS